MGHNDNRDTLATLARGLFTRDAEELMLNILPKSRSDGCHGGGATISSIMILI